MWLFIDESDDSRWFVLGTLDSEPTLVCPRRASGDILGRPHLHISNRQHKSIGWTAKTKSQDARNIQWTIPNLG
jgi:hypothetical protein